MDFGSDNPVPLLNEADFFMYFILETVDRVAPGFEASNEANLRVIAANVILQNSKSSDKLDAFVPYLAMTFFDRFISRNQLPNVLGRVRDDVVLAANCCLTIAWKMRDKSFSLFKFMEKNNLNRDYQKHILKMELEILEGLEWRMRAVTAMCFVPYFLRKSSVRGIRRRAVNEIIIESQEDISFTRFKPSVIAAAAVIVACRLGVRDGNVKILPHNRCRLSLIATRDVDDEQVDRCSEMMVEMCMKKKMFVEVAEEIFQDLSLKVAGYMPMVTVPEEASWSGSSSHSRRPGKQPMHEIKEIQVEEPEIKSELELEAEAEAEAGMDFELKWQLDPNELPHQLSSIDSPLFRPPATAASASDEAKDKPSSTRRHRKGKPSVQVVKFL